MSERRAVWTTLAELLSRLEDGLDAKMSTGPSNNGMGELEKEIHRLSKTQFKANALATEQSGQMERALAQLEAVQQQKSDLLNALIAEQVASVHQEWLSSLLPILDGLDHAIESGEHYLSRRDLAATAAQLTSAQEVLVSPADRAVLKAWLEGLELIRQRLLRLLEARGVTLIPAVGQPFDPHLHVAVATASNGAAEPGTIVAEERRGYRTSDTVLRFAEVVVCKEPS